LPTLGDIQQAVQAVFDGVRRDIEAFGRAVDLAVQRQITAIRRDLAAVSRTLVRIFGGGQTAILPMPPLPPGTDTVYGNPAQNMQYWESDGAQTSALTAAAMVIGQLTGIMPTLKQMIAEASVTDSVDIENAKMYRGLGVWVKYKDGDQLLENHGIAVTGYFYTKDQGGLALTNLETALAQGKSAIVYVAGKTVSTYDGAVWTNTKHAATVIGIDTTNGMVYLNDGGLPNGGQNLTVPLADFMTAWQSDLYTTVIAQLAAPVQLAKAA
jgi:hypothetical protein